MIESSGSICHPVNVPLTFPIGPMNPHVNGNWAIQMIGTLEKKFKPVRHAAIAWVGERISLKHQKK